MNGSNISQHWPMSNPGQLTKYVARLPSHRWVERVLAWTPPGPRNSGRPLNSWDHKLLSYCLYFFFIDNFLRHWAEIIFTYFFCSQHHWNIAQCFATLPVHRWIKKVMAWHPQGHGPIGCPKYRWDSMIENFCRPKDFFPERFTFIGCLLWIMPHGVPCFLNS